MCVTLRWPCEVGIRGCMRWDSSRDARWFLRRPSMVCYRALPLSGRWFLYLHRQGGKGSGGCGVGRGINCL